MLVLVMAKNQNKQQGFITMIVMMILVLVFFIGLAYLRVKKAN
jgi:Tfp pilus assembly protein PilX